jgi:hypothetical protein
VAGGLSLHSRSARLATTAIKNQCAAPTIGVGVATPGSITFAGQGHDRDPIVDTARAEYVSQKVTETSVAPAAQPGSQVANTQGSTHKPGHVGDHVG